MRITFRREHLDRLLSETEFYGKVLDVGGKKEEKRGVFRPPLNSVESWEYLNIDEATQPDYLCSAYDMPFDNETFDVILLSEVLEHLENPEDALQECFRILKPSGKVIISMPFLFPIHADPYDFQRWTKTKISSTLINLGANDVKVSEMGGAFAVIHDILYSCVNSPSGANKSIRRVLARRFLLPVIRLLFSKLDNKYKHKSKIINTGYYVEAKK